MQERGCKMQNVWGSAVLNGFSETALGEYTQSPKDLRQGVISVPWEEHSKQREEQARIPFGEHFWLMVKLYGSLCGGSIVRVGEKGRKWDQGVMVVEDWSHTAQGVIIKICVFILSEMGSH